MSGVYNGPDRRKGTQCEDCTVNTSKLTALEVRHENVMQSLSAGNSRMDKLTSALEETNKNLGKVCLQLAEQRGARKMGLVIASMVGSVVTFLGEISVDHLFHSASK